MTDHQPRNHKSDSTAPQGDFFREAAITGLAKRIDQILGHKFGEPLAPVLFDAQRLDTDSLTACLSNLGRENLIPRGVVLRKGQGPQLARAVENARTELRKSLGSEVSFIFAEHATADDARWTAECLRKITSRNPRGEYCLLLEGIVPDGMPSDMQSLVRMFPQETTDGEHVTVLRDIMRNTFPSPELRQALSRQYSRVMDVTRAQDLTPIWSNPSVAARIERETQDADGSHDFIEWDNQFRRETCALAQSGVKFRVAFEESPLESCVLTLKYGLLMVAARMAALHGQSQVVLRATALGILCHRDSSELRDEGLAQTIRAHMRKNPHEHILVPRGLTHHSAFSKLAWGEKIQASCMAQTGDRYDIDSINSDEALVSIMQTGTASPADMGKLARTFLEMELHSALVAEFNVPRVAGIIAEDMAKSLSDECGLQWLNAVIGNRHASHAEICHATIAFLRKEGGPQAQPFLDQIEVFTKR